MNFTHMNNESNKPNQTSGHLHPISTITREIFDIFRDIGFDIATGPEIETEHYNFDTLNIPADHPARDMWDTFWLKPLEERKLLRTHTSPVQIRFMEDNKPPIKIIAPGKTFRSEATDATHEAQFYQLEGLMVDKNVSMGDLKGTLEYLRRSRLDFVRHTFHSWNLA
jgi:phenylalanyl-tRNA synthetase alpha chain